MLEDIDDTLTLLRDVLEHSDTGFVRLPVDLIGIKQAAARRGLSERTLRRYSARHGIALKVSGMWLVAVQGLNALEINDTGQLDDTQHDIKIISQLTCWPTRASTRRGLGVTPTWHSVVKEIQMNISSTPRYPETLRLRTPEGMSAALQYIARRRAQSTSDWVRQVLLDRLQDEGLSITDTGHIATPDRL